MLNPSLRNINLASEEYKKYARHLILEQIGVNGQKRLKASKILFIGAGGLASSAILYLIAAGIGSIGVIDDDRVSSSNLNRQILYSQKDINKMKVDSVKSKIYNIQPKCKVSTYSFKLNKNNSENIIKQYDIIIDTCDNFKTRYIISDSCKKLHKPHIYGAIDKFQGQISVFNYKDGPKYSELYPESLKLSHTSCNTGGVLGFLTGIIGLLQAAEAVKIILGIREILSGKILIYNLIESSFKIIHIHTQKIKEKMNCQQIQENAKIINMNRIDSIQMISITNRIIIDIRGKTEFKKSSIKKAINISLNRIKSKKAIEFFTKHWKNKILIIYCSNESRSVIASRILSKRNINHYVLMHRMKK
uniref:Probable molybdopterin-synthase adenylyltransferase n=1 Tax=Rhodymenia pseudopalmata TaxID=31502 RepID=A0A1C9C7R8_RHOPU|nr:molybdopterin biosynthesis protein [Rhodymenia pseudopalmata]AOM64435.1 molybdopterin biosynthesis protein [Rhodymenia pseudopalmata]